MHSFSVIMSCNVEASLSFVISIESISMLSHVAHQYVESCTCCFGYNVLNKIQFTMLAMHSHITNTCCFGYNVLNKIQFTMLAMHSHITNTCC